MSDKVFEFEVTDYIVKVFNLKPPRAYIRLKGNGFNGTLEFLPIDEGQGHTGIYGYEQSFRLTMNFKLLDTIIDLLRNEKPIVVQVDLINHTFSLKTSWESVGEEEISG